MKFDEFGNPIDEQSTINPVVAEYLKKKMAPSEEIPADVNPWVKFAAGAGAAIAGRDPNEAISYFDRARQTELNRLEQIRRQREDEARRAEDVEFRNKQAATDEAFRQKQLQMQDAQRRDALQAQAAQRRDAQQMQAQAAQEKQAEAQSTQGKMNKLNSADKARFDNALMAIKGLDEMSSALGSGQNTFSLVGDNDYTAAARRATEAYGRMQSGGAINKDEEARFQKALPQVTDTSEMQKNKIQTQRNEMLSRLKTLGFSPDELGVGNAQEQEAGGEIERIDPKSGRTVIYDAKTKQPLRWK